MVEEKSVNITEAEAALYDRQIRLWGLDAQKRLRAAKVLLIGLGGLGAEVAKNIVLSGIKSLTLLDHRPVTEVDACSQFLVSRDDLGRNRAESSQPRTQQLNPMVEVATDTSAVADKDDDFFTTFDVVCATCCSEEQLYKINDICHRSNIMFFAGDVNGYYGYMFADLNQHEYAEDVVHKNTKDLTEKNGVDQSGDGEPPSKKPKPEVDDTKTVKKMATFSRLKSALSVDWSSDVNTKKIKRTPQTYFIYLVLLKFRGENGRDPDPQNCDEDKNKLLEIRDSIAESKKIDKTTIPDDFTEHCFGQLSPVCAVTGGVLGQEIIKAVSRKDGPHNNFFFYNAVEGSGMVDCIA